MRLIGNNFKENLKYKLDARSLKGGIRYLFSRDEKMNIRLDFAYGKDSYGMYITIGEAF